MRLCDIGQRAFDTGLPVRAVLQIGAVGLGQPIPRNLVHHVGHAGMGQPRRLKRRDGPGAPLFDLAAALLKGGPEPFTELADEFLRQIKGPSGTATAPAFVFQIGDQPFQLEVFAQDIAALAQNVQRSLGSATSIIGTGTDIGERTDARPLFSQLPFEARRIRGHATAQRFQTRPQTRIRGFKSGLSLPQTIERARRPLQLSGQRPCRSGRAGKVDLSCTIGHVLGQIDRAVESSVEVLHLFFVGVGLLEQLAQHAPIVTSKDRPGPRHAIEMRGKLGKRRCARFIRTRLSDRGDLRIQTTKKVGQPQQFLFGRRIDPPQASELFSGLRSSPTDLVSSPRNTLEGADEFWQHRIIARLKLVEHRHKIAEHRPKAFGCCDTSGLPELVNEPLVCGGQHIGKGLPGKISTRSDDLAEIHKAAAPANIRQHRISCAPGCREVFLKLGPRLLQQRLRSRRHFAFQTVLLLRGLLAGLGIVAQASGGGPAGDAQVREFLGAAVEQERQPGSGQ